MKYLIAALLSSAKLCLPCARLAVTTKEKSSWPCAPFGGSPESSPQLVGQKEHGRSGGSCFIKWINYLTSFLNKSPFCTLGYFSVPLHRHHQGPQVQLVRTFWDKPCSLLLFLLLGFFVSPPPPPRGLRNNSPSWTLLPLVWQMYFVLFGWDERLHFVWCWTP